MKINKKNITAIHEKPMGKLMVTYKGKTIQYLINTQVQPYVADKIIEDILKHYPAEVPVDFIEMW
jgi:hypothetical protein|tara:strand:+ start:137 stop:331 length:195 start_codon:yes stop_codon:yes gene_type:complete